LLAVIWIYEKVDSSNCFASQILVATHRLINTVRTAVSCNYNFAGTEAQIKYICQWKGISAATSVRDHLDVKKRREVHWIYCAEGEPRQ